MRFRNKKAIKPHTTHTIPMLVQESGERERKGGRATFGSLFLTSLGGSDDECSSTSDDDDCNRLSTATVASDSDDDDGGDNRNDNDGNVDSDKGVVTSNGDDDDDDGVPLSQQDTSLALDSEQQELIQLRRKIRFGLTKSEKKRLQLLRR